jgi:hypothetical protein
VAIEPGAGVDGFEGRGEVEALVEAAAQSQQLLESITSFSIPSAMTCRPSSWASKIIVRAMIGCSLICKKSCVMCFQAREATLPELYGVLVTALIALLAFFVQGFAGFGAALIMTPLLIFVHDLQTAVVAAAIAQLPVGAMLTYRARAAIDGSMLRLLLPISVVFIFLGSLVLGNWETDWLRRIFGLLTMLFALRILLLAGRNLSRRRWPMRGGYLAGAVAGFLGGLFGTSGPPVVVFLENQLNSAAALRATLLSYFLATNVLRLFSYGSAQLLTWPVILVGLVMIPAALLGGYLGSLLQGRVPARPFRLIVGSLLLLTGLLLALR